MKNFLKNKYFWVFALILVVGIFLRAYNFSPWIHFELDQARDAILIDQALSEGPGELTLLGPRAAGTKLRLGPAFYYFEYTGSLLVGDAVIGSAYVTLFFSILSIVAAYFLFRRYFSEKISLSLLAIFSVSLFLITYSRFAWNPNLIPFFILTTTYFALRAVDKEEEKKGRYLILTALFFSLLTHLHFLALMISAATLFLFFVYKRPEIKLKFWLVAVGVFVLISTPMAINEIKTGGDNFAEFMGAIGKKSDETEADLFRKVVRNYTEHSLGYGIVLSGHQKSELPLLNETKTGNYDIVCKRHCRDHLFGGMLSAVFMSLGLLLLLWSTWKEKEPKKKDFLIFTSVLFVISFVLFTPLSFDLSPRFFLVEIMIPFVLLGLFFKKASGFARGWNVALLVVIVLVFSNLFFVKGFLDELKLAKSESIEIGRDRILKQKTRITLEQQNAIVEYMKGFYEKNGYPVFMKGQSEFHRAFAYLLDKQGIVRDGILMSSIYEEGNYFLILRTQSDMEPYREKYGEKFDFAQQEEFGTLTVFRLSPKKSQITDKKADPSKFQDERDEDDPDEEARRYKWNEIFSD